MWLFGYQEKEVVNTEKEIQKINNTINTLNKREDLLNKQIKEEYEMAKKHKNNKNFDAAKECMRKKIELEKQKNGIIKMKNNTQTMSSQLELSILEMDTLAVQKSSAKTMKKLYKQTYIIY